MEVVLLLVFSAFYGSNAFILDHTSSRHVTKVLTVTNGGPWGDWHRAEYCADGTYATGYEMKIEGYQLGADDTALNEIKLECHSPTGGYGGSINSAEGNWGTWVGLTSCKQNAEFLTSFKLQVEGNQDGGDDTAANFIDFKCRGFDGSAADYELDHGNGQGAWGTFGGWSETCPSHSAICGMQIRMEKSLGGDEDDTALNDVKLFCCAEE